MNTERRKFWQFVLFVEAPPRGEELSYSLKDLDW